METITLKRMDASKEGVRKAVTAFLNSLSRLKWKGKLSAVSEIQRMRS